jgi:hypothetical protein
MKRKIAFSQQIQTVDQELFDQRYDMVALAKLAQAVLGTNTLLSDLPCTATSPASLNVSIGPGQVYRMTATDATDYGTITADSTQVLKQGLLESTVARSCPAPVTIGQSINYLIQFTLAENDVNSYVANYFNPSNPSAPYNGPGNSGASQYKYRECQCIVSVKAGTSATTGTQTTPSPDAGYVGGYVVTVAYGQTTITSGNIALYTNAPFISETLTTKLSQASADLLYPNYAKIQNQTNTYAADTGAVNAYAASLTPAPVSLTTGMKAVFKASVVNTGASTFNLNGIGAVSITRRDGSALLAGDIPAGAICEVIYDGAAWQLQNYDAGRVPVGTVAHVFGSAADAGWLIRDGKTIGDATSGATGRANSDTYLLFAKIWLETTNTTDSGAYYLQDSSGSPVARGASAAADFAAHRRMPLPDDRGRHDEGLNTTGSGVNPSGVLGASQAGQTKSVSVAMTGNSVSTVGGGFINVVSTVTVGSEEIRVASRLYLPVIKL